jgi:glycosyltransferase involved in cell wall biosynthesis
MRVLVYPHDFGLGGSQLNAVEIAAAVAANGHEVAVFGRPGALLGRIEQLGLEFIAAPPPGRRPSPATVNALVGLIDSRGFDVLHGYEWPPALEMALATRARPRAVAVATVMSMAVAPFIPRSMPLLVGTEQIAANERAAGRTRVGLLEPPVDLAFNDPGAGIGLDDFRRRFGVDDSRFTVVSVTRFARELKLEGTLAAIDAVAALAATLPIRLVLVGDGPARDEVDRHAAAANQRAGRGTIVVTGRLDDPRAAYASADVTLGMGGSALRALAFTKPLIVQGEGGFWETLTPDTVGQFLEAGWYGIGNDPRSGVQRLETLLRELVPDAERRAWLARFGRGLVESRFSLGHAARVQIEHYESAIAGRAGRVETVGADAVAFARYGRYYAAKRIRRALGSEKTDDFNARPARAVTAASK